jgi:cell division protein FtsZ
MNLFLVRKPCEELEERKIMINFAGEKKNAINMSEKEIIPFFDDVKDTMQGIIKVIGVGGGGCNAVRNMYNEKVTGVTFAACNTDSQSLKGSPVPVKVLMGEGLGAGGFPEIGKSEAEKSEESLKNILSDGTKMVFITASMGGGTGTGSAPVIAKMAKDLGLLTIGVVTIPFFFEKKQKIIKALKGVDEMRKHVDALLIINNERLCDVYADSDISLHEAFERADNILKDAVKGISELITVHSEGSINLDFRDVEATMKDGGGAIMAMGRAGGEHRVEKAIIDALNSPLLYGNDIGKAKRILFNLYASSEHPIIVREMLEIDDFFDQLDPNINVIWGTSTDDSLGEDAKVTILATGLEDEARNTILADVHRDEDDFYEDLINQLYKPVKKEVSMVITKDVEVPFDVKPVQAVEPAVEEPVVKVPADDEPVGEEPEKPVVEPVTVEERPAVETPIKEEPTLLNKWKIWLSNLIKDVTE